MDNLRKSRGKICDEIWKQISRVVKEYVRQTEVKRLEVADMRRADEREMKERMWNEKKMKADEVSWFRPLCFSRFDPIF